MEPEEIVEELMEKYSEWLEMERENAPILLVKIIAKLLYLERMKNECYIQVIRNYQQRKI